MEPDNLMLEAIDLPLDGGTDQKKRVIDPKNAIADPEDVLPDAAGVSSNGGIGGHRRAINPDNIIADILRDPGKGSANLPKARQANTRDTIGLNDIREPKTLAALLKRHVNKREYTHSKPVRESQPLPDLPKLRHAITRDTNGLAVTRKPKGLAARLKQRLVNSRETTKSEPVRESQPFDLPKLLPLNSRETDNSDLNDEPQSMGDLLEPGHVNREIPQVSADLKRLEKATRDSKIVETDTEREDIPTGEEPEDLIAHVAPDQLGRLHSTSPPIVE